MPRFRAKNGMFAVKRGCQKIFQEKSEICLDMCNGIWYYMQVRNWAHSALFARYCDEPGDCSGF